MAIDAYGQTIYLVTDAGLTIVQLGTAPLSIGHLVPSAGPPGTNVVIHGSGFQPTTIVSANGAPATAAYVDANTLDATIPGGMSGSVKVTVTNSSGQFYFLDNAFAIQ